MGMLGQQNAMDVPFNIISYTSKLVEDQQAKTIADVIANDAGVQFVQGYGNSAETYRIRGLKFDGDDMTFGGLSGVLPRQVVDTQMVERIEIFKGANALMNGAASSGVGGMINLEPKHAGERPQAKVGVDYTSDSPDWHHPGCGPSLRRQRPVWRAGEPGPPRRGNRHTERSPPHHAALHWSGL